MWGFRCRTQLTSTKTPRCIKGEKRIIGFLGARSRWTNKGAVGASAHASVARVHVTAQAKAQFYLRTHMADESKNEYAAQLQNFNGEQWKHFNNAIPHIFKVEQTC